ncbi:MULTISPECIES: N-acetylmuramidase domain-containing protein [unclassified Methylobacterium]|uniref:N-acetylmuramidase domain-containing protein n=1 Tax=unclassified Methylobacterium TaxID=2615210 RepID=UPI00226A0309|nr:MULTISPECIES: N-acetylmuramidase domain-containing protein [unclassified Methylobacterium]
MKLDPRYVAAVVAAAPQQGIEPAALLAVVETETNGRPFESADLDPSDGIEPAMLYERHVAYRGFAAKGADILAEAKRQGLVVPKWQGPRSAQYADQGTSAGRLALIARAAALDPEVAYASCSMGWFQVLGENHKHAGFDSAVEMHSALTRGGIEAHLACGVAFMRSTGLIRHLAAHDWAAFARGYNGKQFKKNGYDTKLAAAYAEWTTKLPAAPAPAATLADASTLKLGDRGPRVRALQESLAAFGTPVKADSIYGPATRRAVGAAQVELGLTGDGVATSDFVAKLEAAPALAKGEREVAPKSEVKEVSSLRAPATTSRRSVGSVSLPSQPTRAI